MPDFKSLVCIITADAVKVEWVIRLVRTGGEYIVELVTCHITFGCQLRAQSCPWVNFCRPDPAKL